MKGIVMNSITILRPNAEGIVVEYTEMAEIQLAVLKAGMGAITEPEVIASNKEVFIEAPAGTPKNRQSELETICKTFGFGGLSVNEDAEWEKGAFGSKVDWSEDEPLIHRGVDVSNKEHCEMVRKTIAQFQAATASWKELKELKIVGVDGNFHIKTLAKYRKARGKK
jgi:hypothetical protein